MAVKMDDYCKPRFTALAPPVSNLVPFVRMARPVKVKLGKRPRFADEGHKFFACRQLSTYPFSSELITIGFRWPRRLIANVLQTQKKTAARGSVQPL